MRVWILLGLFMAAVTRAGVEVKEEPFASTWTDVARAQVSDGRSWVEVDGKRVEPSKETDHAPAARTTGGVTVQRRVERVEQPPVVTISVRIENQSDREVSLGTAVILDARWELDDLHRSPAAVFISGDTVLACEPAGKSDERQYKSSEVLNLASADQKSSLLIGYMSADQARPELSATFKSNGDGQRLAVSQRFSGRRLGAHESLELDPLCLLAMNDPYAALETYARFVATAAKVSRPHPANALWCSWYAHRMAMTEDLVLANAAVAAKYFKPLGFEIMQLDHGWQRGDVTGDWVPNERFPHGLKWLAEQLKSRYGMRLGTWIAPTDAADVSQLYRDHPDWMLKDDQGKPKVNWKWYWKPNPDCYELDATNPAARAWLKDTFARLTSEGVSYYKIDFIAASASEGFVQSDPHATRGWGPLREAMAAIREGAGDAAQIRYCQTPPLLSLRYADRAICGEDTLDAGIPGRFDVLRNNARSLAAGYWINDVWYHREVCDMSVRMQADVEEARLRLAMMTLAGCSISFSDELQHLPMSRIRMMQQCLPPGAPVMRPVDLFERTVPSVWKLACEKDGAKWDVYGLFNFEEKSEERAIELPADSDSAVFGFYEGRLLGVKRGQFAITLAPHTCRVISVRKLSDVPQVVGTDMHLLQGWHELSGVRWDDAAHTLSGKCHRAPGMTGRVFVYVPETFTPHFDFPLKPESAHLTHIDGPLWAAEIQFGDGADAAWSVPFDAVKK